MFSLTPGNAVGPVRHSRSTQCRLLSFIKKQHCSSMKITFPKFYELYENKCPTRGTSVFLKIEGDLQAICDMHHLAFCLPIFHRDWKEFLYGRRDERALLLDALSTLLLLTYEEATRTGEWFITGRAPLAPSHISNVVRWGGVLSSVCTWTLWTR